MSQKLRFFLLSLCWLGGATVAHAQTNFRPGYVLPLTGDTLRGEVDSREGRTNAQRCRFRATAQAEVTTYQPADLRGYGLPLEKRHYRSFPVTIAPAPVRPYFLEVLVDGPAKLYFLRDAEQHESFYIESPKQPLTLLEHSKTIVQGNGIAKIEEKNLYRNTLAAALAGCVQAQSKLPNLPFQESALRQVVNLYNQCVGYAAPQAKFAGVPTHATIGIMAAVSGQRLYFDGFPFASDITSQQTGFAIGPVMHVNSSRVSQRLSLVVALLYEAEKYEVGPSRKPAHSCSRRAGHCPAGARRA